MKEAWIEFRLYMAEKLLSWAFDVAPSNEKDGHRIKMKVIEYFEKQQNLKN